MSLSKVFFYFCIAFLIGVFLASFFTPSFSFYFLFVMAGLMVSVVFYKKEFAVFGLCFFVLLLGVFWEEKFEREIVPAPQNVHYYNNEGEVLIEGIATGDSQETAKGSQVILGAEKIASDNNKVINGKILLFLSPGIDLKYGDRILIKGKLATPENFTPEFNYKEYLRAKRIYSLSYNPEIKIISQNNGNIVLGGAFSLKRKFKETSNILLPPEGAFLEGITLGDKSRFSKEFQDKISLTGLSHINAVSGMNITILFGVFFFVFIFLGLWRKQATILTIFILFFYILTIGAPSSAIRAGIMGSVLYVGWSLGRLSQSLRSIVFAATGMVVFNPLILSRDVGFQLSFLAIFGLLFLYPVFDRYFKAENSLFKILLFQTIAAQLFCFPILVYNFGTFSILSPLANILVLPLIPFLTVGGFLFLAIGTIFKFLALPLSFLIRPFFSWIVLIVEKISVFPFVAISFKIHWIFILIFYIFTILLIFRLKDQPQKV